jgi:hypothetical protein
VAKIGMQLDLTDAKLHSPKALALTLTHAEVSGVVIASKGFEAVGNVDATGAKIDNGLYLLGARLEHLNAVGVRVGGLLILNASEVRGAVRLDRAEIAGGVFAEGGFKAFDVVSAQGAKIDGKLGLQNATLHNPGGDALSLEGAHITRGVFANENFAATGQIDAPEARIGGGLYLNGATLSNPGKTALRLNSSDIGGDMIADDIEVHGQVAAVGVRIGGQLRLHSAHVENTCDALALADAHIAGGVYADKLSTSGRVFAPGAKIGVQLSLKGAKLHSPEQKGADALHIDRAQIEGSVFACEDFEAVGQVRAVGATIEGQLDLRRAKLDGRLGTALRIDNSSIGRGVVAGEGLLAFGCVSAVETRIDGASYLNGAELVNPGGCALRLDRADIAGDIFAGNGFRADGEVSAVDAKIEGQLDLTGAKLDNSDRDALNLEGVRVTYLKLNDLDLDGRLNLKRATIQHLETAKPAPKPLVATGWKIGDLHGPLRDDRAAAQDWLNTTPDEPVSVQPWLAVADVYQRNGDAAAARRLRFAAENKQTGQSPCVKRLFRGGYCLLLGNGYYPRLAAVWLVCVVAVGLAIVANNRESILPARPADAEAAVKAYFVHTPAEADRWLPVTAETPCQVIQPNYRCMNTLSFTLDKILAPASVTTQTDWTVAPNGTAWLTAGLPILKVTTWLLAALVLAAATGLLRKT